MAAEPPPDMVAQLVDQAGVLAASDHPGGHDESPYRVGDSRDPGLHHVRMGIQAPLDLQRTDRPTR
jgi:hypothetical protein